MRSNFERNIKNYTEHIKDSSKDLSKEGRTISGIKKTSLLEKTTQESHTNIEAENNIYILQKGKLEKLNKFKKFLESTRKEDYFKHAVVNSNIESLGMVSFLKGEFFLSNKNSAQEKIKFSEIITDNEWGMEYDFDNSIDIQDIRSYYLSVLKSDLREKLDKQIIISETSNTYTDTGKQEAYQRIGKRIEEGSEQQGVIAEKMVKNFLKKVFIETDSDFEIIDSDVYQDVEQKIDFIIHRRTLKKNRGVGVTEFDASTDIGIQFTTNFEKVSHKESQIEKSNKRNNSEIDGIVLVALPAHQASYLYKDWSKNKKPGGPEKNWSKEVRITIFRGVMEKILSPEEIDEFCQKNFI